MDEDVNALSNRELQKLLESIVYDEPEKAVLLECLKRVFGDYESRMAQEVY